MKIMHDKNLPTLVCKYCGKEFKGKSNLTIHEKSHEDHGKCVPSARKYVNLKGHIQTVHESEFESGSATLCDFKFLKKCNLDKHVKNHDNPNRRVKGLPHCETGEAPQPRKEDCIKNI
ncbi:MDS1 and EVI1 complex locus protein EVI1-B [Orchesella cincta]|uniref:MDS1 and EVI1 complex locus protein EVI1-B n=1 Tax=Orchesella cincta TaxID=48709 RepID=A0A1D2MD95_ORCCI|nr:MDS1 and EVI1 complex locus protein EVI1-B [Orchesella cincta]